MTPRERLAALAARWNLGANQAESLARLLELLDADPRAPTTVRGGDAVDVHIADSLSGLGLDCVHRARAIADLGSGAGFPGLVLAVALPLASVALVESASRKCEYLEHARATIGATNARVVRARVEEWTDGRGACDLVCARALAPLPVLCEYAAPLLAPAGALVAWKGEVTEDEAAAGARAAAQMGLRDAGAVRSEPYPGSVAHRLHTYFKVAQTPSGFPRRAGIARKRPLGGAGSGC